MNKEDGGPAFPWPVPSNHQAYHGMTLRDYAQIKFAAAWIAALSTRYGEQGYTDRSVAMEANRLAEFQADAMIEARGK